MTHFASVPLLIHRFSTPSCSIVSYLSLPKFNQASTYLTASMTQQQYLAVQLKAKVHESEVELDENILAREFFFKKKFFYIHSSLFPKRRAF